MAAGLDTHSNHLDDPTFATALAGSGIPPPVFAGRYFATNTSCWAHGEGSAAAVPATLTQIVPIQSGTSGFEQTRQQTTGDGGWSFGVEDAAAICNALYAALSTGEFTVAAESQFYVFLEVADGIALTADYWAGWADTVALLRYDVPRKRGRQPQVPALHFCFVYGRRIARLFACLGRPKCARSSSHPAPRVMLLLIWRVGSRPDESNGAQPDNRNDPRWAIIHAGRAVAECPCGRGCECGGHSDRMQPRHYHLNRCGVVFSHDQQNLQFDLDRCGGVDDKSTVPGNLGY